MSRSVNLNLKSQNERQCEFIWDQRIAVWGASIWAKIQIVSLLQNEGKGFL